MAKTHASFFWIFCCGNTFQFYTDKRSMAQTHPSFFGIFATEINSNFIPIKEA